ncbi:signal peptidase I [Ruminococcus sp. CLA-AA-H200]|uniref:Signal peptidase I n=1 Tax=Ruminococcus turbiniformis TaxID=2881258 RepID=A0ABS8FXB4_9FIRM|nr:signal peptidase I [Ruminococcus turbiniformis]MCC2254597.1 signal peptidase I [Ruminococcus turbiniformis]
MLKKTKTVFFLFLLLGCILLNRLVLLWAYIPSGSMEPTIQTNGLLIGNRLGKDQVERYDIIIFRFPDDPSQLYIKRVIGLPGETIEIKNGEVYADGKNLDDSFCMVLSNDYGVYQVPDDSYFVLGDNRTNSLDSRYWDDKYVAKNQVEAIAAVQVLPLSDFKFLGMKGEPR